MKSHSAHPGSQPGTGHHGTARRWAWSLLTTLLVVGTLAFFMTSLALSITALALPHWAHGSISPATGLVVNAHVGYWQACNDVDNLPSQLKGQGLGPYTFNDCSKINLDGAPNNLTRRFQAARWTHLAACAVGLLAFLVLFATTCLHPRGLFLLAALGVALHMAGLIAAFILMRYVIDHVFGSSTPVISQFHLSSGLCALLTLLSFIFDFVALLMLLGAWLTSRAHAQRAAHLDHQQGVMAEPAGGHKMGAGYHGAAGAPAVVGPPTYGHGLDGHRAYGHEGLGHNNANAYGVPKEDTSALGISRQPRVML